MGMFQDDKGPPLFVPNLDKPAGAVVDADGNVACVTCQTRLPVAKADVVGQGYRCPPCTAKADLAKLTGGPSDVAANLSSSDRDAMRAFAWKWIGVGVLAIAGGVLIYAAIGPLRFAGYLIFAGIGLCAFGATRLNAAR
jgi:hypothetical protein